MRYFDEYLNKYICAGCLSKMIGFFHSLYSKLSIKILDIVCFVSFSSNTKATYALLYYKLLSRFLTVRFKLS